MDKVIENGEAAIKFLAYEDLGRYYSNLRTAATVTPQIKAIQALIAEVKDLRAKLEAKA